MASRKIAGTSEIWSKNDVQNSVAKKNNETTKFWWKNIVDGMIQFWQEDVKNASREIVKDIKMLPGKVPGIKRAVANN